MDLLHPFGDFRIGEDVAEAPTGDGIGLGEGAADDGALAHTRQGGHIGVMVGLIDDVFIDLVGDDVGIVFLGQVGDDHEFVVGEDLAARIGGIAEDEGLGPLLEGRFEDVGVEMEVGWYEGHVDGFGAGEDGVGTVIFVERREDDDLVAWVGDGHHGGHHGFCAAAGNDDFAVRVIVEAGEMLLFTADGFTEILGAPGDGVLVRAFCGYLAQAVGDCLWRCKIGEALGEIDRIVLIGDAGHAADDGIGEMCRSIA